MPKLTYANVTSTLALFLVLAGGTAFAAEQLAKDSVGSKQIKKEAVTTAKLKNSAVTPAKLSGAAKSALTGPQGPQGPKGAPGDEKLVYIAMNADGTWDPARSEGVLKAVEMSSGLYCIDFAGVDDPESQLDVATATLESDGGNVPGEINVGVNGCAGGGLGTGDVYVRTNNSEGAPAAKAFSLIGVLP